MGTKCVQEVPHKCPSSIVGVCKDEQMVYTKAVATVCMECMLGHRAYCKLGTLAWTGINFSSISQLVLDTLNFTARTCLVHICEQGSIQVWKNRF